MPDFQHGTRIFHRTRKQFGIIVVHENLLTDPSSVCVQFDGSSDILEVTSSLLEERAPYGDYKPGDFEKAVSA